MINVKDFGAKGDGVADDTSAINRAFAASSHVHFPTGTYRHSAELRCIKPSVVHIAAEAGTVLMGVGSGFTSLRIGGAPANFDPFNFGSFVLAKPAVAGEAVIQVNGLRVEPGDILRISSPQEWDEVTKHGELVEVDSASGSSITLTRPLFGSYAAATTHVMRLTMPTVNVSNLTIVRASNDQGLLIRCARNVDVNNIRVSGARYAGIVAQFIYGGEIRNCSSRDGWYANTGTSYGLEVTTAQDVDIHSNTLYGGRHALTLGNYEPNRFVSIRGNTLANKPSETVGALNTHGGAQYITITDNKVSGGCEIAATDVTFTGNTVIGDASAVARPLAIFYFSRDSDHLIVTNNVFRSTARENGLSPLHLRFTRRGVSARVIRVAGNIISGRIDQAQGGIWIAPAVSAGQGADSRIGQLEILDNDVSVEGNALSYALLVNDQGGGAGFYPIIRSAVVRGGRYVNASGRAIGFINLNAPDARTGDVVISDLTAESPTQAVYSEGLATLAVLRNRIDGGGTVFSKDVTRLIDVRENRIFNAAAHSGVELGSGNGGEVVVANFYFNSRGVPAGGNQSLRAGPTVQASMNAVTWGSELPTSGEHRRGDVRWRTDAGAGQSPGWVCTSGGLIPGSPAPVWRAMAPLAP